MSIRCFRFTAVLLGIAAHVALGQSLQATSDSTVPDHRAAVSPAVLGGVAVLATIALAPFDHQISGELQAPRLQGADDLHQTAKAFAFFGGPGPFMVGGALMLAGTVTGQSPISAAGRRITESVLLSASITALGKGIFGRALPGVETTHAFSFGRGFHKGNGPFVSFPSGHTAAGFALAAAISGEVDDCAPNLARFVTPLSYSAASMIAIARVYQHVHWPSDLPLAAATGIWSGMLVEARGHRTGQHGAARLLDGLTVMPRSASSMTIAWSSVTP